MVTVKVSPGGHHVTRSASEMIVTVLGSCVAACIRDPWAQIGGMNHFMLPESPDGAWGTASASLRFGNFAMERLINDILAAGGHRRRLEVKVFGGARMIGDRAKVGPRNADFVELYLRDEGLAIAASHLRGARARLIHYIPLTGQVRLLELPREAVDVAVAEVGYRARMGAEPAAGSMEMFD